MHSVHRLGVFAHRRRARGLIAVFAAALLGSSSAPADPPRAARDFSLESSGGATRRLRDYAGRVLIIVYEDQASNHQNDALKAELAARARSENLTREVALAPVADLHEYNFWPAAGFARDAVRDIADDLGVEVLMDWTGAMARAYGFRPHTSAVVLVGSDGAVLARYDGPMNPGARWQFFGALRAAIAARGGRAAR